MNTRIGVFASGEGTNAERIFRYFAGDDTAEVSLYLEDRDEAYNPVIIINKAEIEVALLLCNRQGAGVLARAKREGVPVHVFKNSDLEERPETMLKVLREKRIDWLVLAGFIRRLPAEVVAAYRGRILNIHPALLPKYGGKGMYGARVHAAVLEAGEKESGITIHEVDEDYDRGQIVRQVRTAIDANTETVDTLSARIRQLEHQCYPRIICEEVLRQRLQQRGAS